MIKKKRIVLAILAILGIWATDSGLAANLNSFPFDDSDWARLTKGGVVVGLNSDDTDRRKVVAAVVIDAPAQPIWDVLLDYDHAASFIPGLERCTVLEQAENEDIIEHQVKFSALFPKVTYVYRARYDVFSRINFHRIRGDLRELQGSWMLEEINSDPQTLVVYSVHLNPGFPVPQWLVHILLKKDLPKVLLAIKNRVLEPNGARQNRSPPQGR